MRPFTNTGFEKMMRTYPPCVLEDANLQLASVVTDISGVSAQAMLGAILAGERDVETLANLARGRLRAKRDQLKEACEGRVTARHSFLLTEHLSALEVLGRGHGARQWRN